MHKYFKNRYKTSHLSEQENAELMTRYYEGEKINQLIKDYNIDIHPNSISSTFQLSKVPEKICKYCKSVMCFIPPSKSHQYKKEYVCPSCYHKEGTYNCKCRSCITYKQDEANKRRLLSKKTNKVNDIYDSLLIQKNAISIEDLSLKERAYLGALLRCYPIIQNNFFVFKRRTSSSFAPTIPYSNVIFETLLNKGLLFEVSSNEQSIKLAINIKNTQINKNIFIDLMYPKRIENVDEELFELIRDVQIYESIEYFTFITQKFMLPYFTQSETADKFYILFKRILASGYSTSQLYNFIYISIRNTATKNNCSRQNIDYLDAIYIALANRYSSAIAENWSIKNYNRIYQQKGSELFKLISNDLLGIGETLFYKPFDI